MNINATETCLDMSGNMTAEEIFLETLNDNHIGVLSNYVMHSWPLTNEILKEGQPYRSEMK